MTACDLNGTTKPWEIQKEVSLLRLPTTAQKLLFKWSHFKISCLASNARPTTQ